MAKFTIDELLTLNVAIGDYSKWEWTTWEIYSG